MRKVRKVKRLKKPSAAEELASLRVSAPVLARALDARARSKDGRIPKRHVYALLREARENIVRIGKAYAAQNAVVITVTNRADDVHACITGQPRFWGCGRTANEAIGDLVRNHPRRFGIGAIGLPAPRSGQTG